MKNKGARAIILNLVVGVSVYLVLSFVVVMMLYEGIFSRAEASPYSMFITYEDMADYPCREVEFVSEGNTLKGRVYNADSTEGIVILGHGKGGSGADLLPQARFFADNGLAAMVFDLRGHGDSTGTSQRGLCCAAEDMKNAVLFCENDEQLSGKPVYLFGFGESGYGASLCAGMDSVKAVTSVSAFSRASAMSLEYAVSKMSVFAYLEYPVIWLYQFIIFGGSLGADAGSTALNADVPVMVVHGTADDTVKFGGASLYARLKGAESDKIELISVENGTHSSLMRSAEAVEYLEAFNDEARMLYSMYNGSVPTSEIAELYGKYDREKMSGLDISLMEKVLSMYRSAR